MSSRTKDHINTQAICLSVDGGACSWRWPRCAPGANSRTSYEPDVIAIDIPEKTAIALSTPTMSLMWGKQGEATLYHFLHPRCNVMGDEWKEGGYYTKWLWHEQKQPRATTRVCVKSERAAVWSLAVVVVPQKWSRKLLIVDSNVTFHLLFHIWSKGIASDKATLQLLLNYWNTYVLCSRLIYIIVWHQIGLLYV